MSERAEVIFFDLGDTLGSAVLSFLPIHLVAFDVYPFVPQLLSSLRTSPYRAGRSRGGLGYRENWRCRGTTIRRQIN